MSQPGVVFRGFPLRASGIGLLVFGLAGPAMAQWSEVVPGIDYQYFTASGPNQVFVVRMDRHDDDLMLDSAIGQGDFSHGAEVVPQMAARRQDALISFNNEWGPRLDVIAAVNGDYFEFADGLPLSGQIQSGWHVRRFAKMESHSGLSFHPGSGTFIGGCINYPNAKNVVVMADGEEKSISGINEPPEENDLIIFTSHFGRDTNTDDGSAEVVVRLSGPLQLMPLPNATVGEIVSVATSQGATPLPFDSVVLSGRGSGRDFLVAHAHVGETVRISQELADYEEENCNTNTHQDWTKTFSAVGGNFHFLRGGQADTYPEHPQSDDLEPRTVVAYNSDYFFLVVVDGRRPGVSVGMNVAQLAAFCQDTLGATDAINQDGGGSSTLWVDGEVKNTPSDGSLRSVANAWLMAVRKPADRSTAFRAYDVVSLNTTAEVRLGPGHDHAVLKTISNGTRGEVTPHPAGGLKATGTYWWKCDLGSDAGWLMESALDLVQHGVPPQDGPEDDGGPTGGDSLHTNAWLENDPSFGNDTSGDLGPSPQKASRGSGLRGGCACRQRPGPAPGFGFGFFGAVFFGWRTIHRRRQHRARGLVAGGSDDPPCANRRARQTLLTHRQSFNMNKRYSGLD